MRRTRHHRPMRGHGFMNILKKGHDFLKKTQVVSKVANALHSAGVGGKHNALIGKIGAFAGSHGYGHRRRRRAHGTHRKKVRRGHGIGNFLRKANDWLKKTRVVSTVANALGGVGVPYAGAIGKVSGALGYGRRRRHHRRAHGVRRVHHRRHRVGGAMHRRHHRRGHGIGHVYTPQSGVGIAGTTTYSSGRVLF